MQGFRERLRIARRRAGFESPEDASAALQFGRSTIRDYETGRRAPGVEALRLICLKYKSNADWLLFGVGGSTR